MSIIGKSSTNPREAPIISIPRLVKAYVRRKKLNSMLNKPPPNKANVVGSGTTDLTGTKVVGIIKDWLIWWVLSVDLKNSTADHA